MLQKRDFKGVDFATCCFFATNTKSSRNLYKPWKEAIWRLCLSVGTMLANYIVVKLFQMIFYIL